MTGYLAVPAALAGDISVVVGPRLLAGVADAPGLSAHRRRWGECPTLGAQQLVDLTRDGQVAGRGGAGFPFSRKLATAISANKKRTMVVNAAEGEPGSAKDSTLLLTVPHLVLDGATVVARALDVASVHLIIPGERPAIRPAIEAAIAEHDGGIEFLLVETSAGFPAACSGAMYSGVPIATFGLVSFGCAISISICRAMPKSSTFTKSAWPVRAARKMFSGLRSRWITFTACAASRARQSCTAMFTARSTPRARSRWITSARSQPSRYSMTKYTAPVAVVPESVTSTMLGWPIREAARASRRKRATTSGKRE